MYVCALDECLISKDYFECHSSISDAIDRAKANGDKATERFAEILWLNAKNFQQHLDWNNDHGSRSPGAYFYVPFFNRWLNNLG